MSAHTYLPTPCVHVFDAEHRKVCDGCERLLESCYPCLLDGFRGSMWMCPGCRA
jgi:hypothetical protein